MERYERLTAAYLSELRPRLSAASVAQWRGLLASFRGFLESVGVREIDGVTSDTLRAYLHYLQTGPISRLGRYRREAGGIRQRLLHLAAFFRWLVARKELAADPFVGVALPPAAVRVTRHLLTEEEVARLLALPATDEPLGVRDRALLELVYSAGLRGRELAALNVADADLAAGRVTIRAAGPYPERTSAVGASAVAWLARYLTEVRPVQLRDSRERALFLSQMTGGRLEVISLCEVMKRYARRAGLGRRFGWVALRRTCAARLLREGADAVAVRALLDPPLPAASTGDPRMVRR